MKKPEDLNGLRFSRLIVMKRRRSNGKLKCICRCDCGAVTLVYTYNLKNGHTQSCGCLQRERTSKANTIHGARGTRLYQTWINMRRRCYEQKHKNYPNYGARGIRVCDLWRNDFAAFRTWAKENGYTKHLTIERNDNDGHYEPGNCTWIPLSEQSKNRRFNRFLTLNGKTQSLSDWSRETGINISTISMRLDRYGWSVNKTLTTRIIK